MNPLATADSVDEILEFGVPRENEERRDGGCGIVLDPTTGLFAVGKQHENGSHRLFSGGVDPDEDVVTGVLREVTEESGLHDFAHVEQIGQALTHYRNTLKNVNRVAHATCLLVILNSADLKPTSLEEHEKFDLVWTTGAELLADFEARNENRDNDHWIHFMNKALARIEMLGHKIR